VDALANALGPAVTARATRVAWRLP
jgi:hypothetical protein